MAGQPDLFATAAARYPNHPGFRNETTSLDAARAVKPRAGHVRDKVMAALEKVGPMTAVQLAAHLGLPYETVQPRTSELSRKGQIEDSGRRGPSRDPAKLAIVWRATTASDVSTR
ncbi:MAG: hypothetical protein ACOVMT_04225 [Caulobacter sp.]|jgi:hypothetical protein